MKFKFGQSQLMPVLLAIVLGFAMPAMAQNTSQRSGLTSADRELLTRQQLRLDTFEESLKRNFEVLLKKMSATARHS